MLMYGLTHGERQRLLYGAKEIYIHKFMIIQGYKILINRTSNDIIRRLLIRICEVEEKYAEFWVARIIELGGSRPKSPNWKIRLMLGVLGTKGFFEWAVIGVEEGINALTIQAAKIQDPTIYEKWIRDATEERLHLNWTRSKVLGMEHWEIRGAMGVRDMIFGANDGIVSTMAFVAGVAGAATSNPYTVLLAGFAFLVSGTFSMAAGSYQSSKSELEVMERDQRWQFDNGGKPTEVEPKKTTDSISKKPEVSIKPDALDEIGLTSEELGNPVKAGFLTGISFAIAAFIPLLPYVIAYLIPNITVMRALFFSIFGTLTGLFGIGALKTIFSKKWWIRSGLEMMMIGVSAAAITFYIGKAFAHFFGELPC